MKADIYIQKNSQSESGTINRQWIYSKTIPCKVVNTKSQSGTSRGDDKTYGTGVNAYSEDVHLKMQSPIILSKRWRISSIRTNDGDQLYIEVDKISDPDTYFDVISNHPVTDPFGRISYYEVNLRRAVIQDNDTITV